MALPGVHAQEVAWLKGWPALETAHDGSWVLRASRGHTDRANSVWCLNPADDDEAPGRLEKVVAWYKAWSLPATFRVTPLCGTGLRQALAEWPSHSHTDVLAMTLAPGQFAPFSEAELLLPTDPAWLAAQERLQGYPPARCEALAAIVAKFEVPNRGVVLRGADGEPIASAVVAVADGIAIVGNVVTAPERRGEGHGGRMLEKALAWAVGEGATSASHGVAADNAPAQRLYAKLGYQKIYDYHYRRPAA